MVWRILLMLILMLAVTVLVLRSWRAAYDRRMWAVWTRLRAREWGEVFTVEMLAGLPDVAQRYFTHAIRPGTRLARSVVLEMNGRISLRPAAGKQAMRAREILATPDGLIWNARVGSGRGTITGYDFYADGDGAMRWWLVGFLPVVRARGPDVVRSAAGRVALESIWLPSALLPARGARWEAVAEHSARVELGVGDEALTLELTVTPSGAVQRIAMMRWDPQGLDGTPAYVLWVADHIAAEGTFDGYTIPTRLLVTARAGTEQAHPFFEAVVHRASFR